MPSRNIVKLYESYAYYHVYNRGVAKQRIFIESTDKRQFLKIIARHLDPADESTKLGGCPYRKFDDNLELLCYCLMNNHFHMLFYQAGDAKAISDFMRSVLTAYTMYFNKKYKRVGPLFQSTYKASRISNDAYLLHITRYIHLNPRTYKTFRYSSLQSYLSTQSPAWLKPQRVLILFEGESYLAFLEDYEDSMAMAKDIKHELADTE